MPFYRHLGIELVKASWGRAEIQVTVSTRLTQSVGFAHGGVTASLVDSAIGLALCTMLDRKVLITTVDLTVNFIAPARLGVLRARGRIIHKGKHLAVGEAEVRDLKGTLISKGSATYMILGTRARRVLDLS
jgi:uncharacterized protein (TIGR00369 family)